MGAKKNQGGKGSKKKKDKAKLKEEAERKAREEEEARRIEEEKAAEEQRKLEVVLMKERKKQENRERKIRVAELTEISEMVNEQQKMFQEIAVKKRKDAKWERFMRCDGTPDPTIQGDINTYINLQSNFNENADLQTVMKNTELDLLLIRELEALISLGIEHDEELTEKDMERFRKTVVSLDDLLQFKLDSSTYLELCRASKNAHPETSNLQICEKNNDIVLCIWGNLCKNLRIKNFEFKEMNFTFEIPKILALTNCAVRLLYTKYDHYSQRSRSFSVRKKPQEKKEEIVIEVKEEEEVEEEKEEKVEEEQQEIEKDIFAALQDDYNPEGEQQVVEEKKPEPEEEEEEEVPEYNFPISPDIVEYEDFDESNDVVDLRACAVVGGIYNFHLLNLPPQPNVCKKWIITEVSYPPKLQFMNYVADVEAGGKGLKRQATLEDMEAVVGDSVEGAGDKTGDDAQTEQQTQQKEEEKKEKEAKKEIKKDNKKEPEVKRDEKPPISVVIKIPSNILFCETPMPAMWDNKNNAWVLKGFTDVKFNEETRIFQFKMNYFGTFALVQDFYINMPFQSWEIRPRDLNFAHLTITAAVLELEFDIKNDLVCLTHPSNPALAHIRDRWIKPEQMVMELQWSGVNVFPSIDASKYVAIQTKSAVLEDSVYQQIALVASAMGFSWSRWNGETYNDDDIVIQATECLRDEPLQEDLQTYLVNKTNVIKLTLTEFDEELNLEPADKTTYYSNFYHFMMKTGSEEAKTRIKNTTPEFRDCVKKFLTATKVLTYS